MTQNSPFGRPSAPEQADANQAPASSGSRRNVAVAAGAGMLAVAVGAGAFFILSSGGDAAVPLAFVTPTPTASATTTTTTTTTTESYVNARNPFLAAPTPSAAAAATSTAGPSQGSVETTTGTATTGTTATTTSATTTATTTTAPTTTVTVTANSSGSSGGTFLQLTSLSEDDPSNILATFRVYSSVDGDSGNAGRRYVVSPPNAPFGKGFVFVRRVPAPDRKTNPDGTNCTIVTYKDERYKLCEGNLVRVA